MSKNENNRFQVILSEKQSISEGSEIIKDTKTGVLYLYHASGYGGGITPLFDVEGKPLIDTESTF